MICVRANSMPTQTKTKTFTAKTAATLYTLKDIRRWLIDNCKNRWTATDYKGDDFNWRKLSKVESFNLTYGLADITIMVHFKKPEDLMLYLLSWPSEVLINS
jgi:hypothetical protein